MRNNLYNNQAHQQQHYSPQFESLEVTLTGSFFVPDDGPILYYIDPGGVHRNVFLPEIPPFGGLVLFFANTGGVGDLLVFDALGASVATVPAGKSAFIISSKQRWKDLIGFPTSFNDFINGLLSNPRQVTADFVALPTDTTIAVVRAAPVLTLGTLPSVTTRAGRPISIVDWSSAVVNHEIRLTPDGVETIMKQATWSLWSNPGNLASVTLWPSIDLNGWYIKP